MKSITLNLVATEEDDDDDFNEFGVDLDVDDDVNVLRLIRVVLTEGVKAAEKEGFKIKDSLFFN